MLSTLNRLLVENIDLRPLIWVRGLNELPTPVDGVIYLEECFSYVFLGKIDLSGNRLECLGDVTIQGISSETSFVTSTGLPVGVPLITTAYSLPLQNITFHDVDTCLAISGSPATLALDWSNTNFQNIPNVGTIGDASNFVVEFLAFLNASGLVFNGTIGTVAFSNTLFSNQNNNDTLHFTATANVFRRFRAVFNSFVTTGTGVSIFVDAAAQFPVDQFILKDNNFAGGTPTHIVGITAQDNRSDFFANKGIMNSQNFGLYFMQNNSTATTVSATNTFYKAAGATTLTTGQRFAHSNNRLIYTGEIARNFALDATVTASAGNNNNITIRIQIFNAANTLIHISPEVTANTAGGNRVVNIKLLDIYTFEEGDYAEVWVANSANQNITVEDLVFRAVQTV